MGQMCSSTSEGGPFLQAWKLLLDSILPPVPTWNRASDQGSVASPRALLEAGGGAELWDSLGKECKSRLSLARLGDQEPAPTEEGSGQIWCRSWDG